MLVELCYLELYIVVWCVDLDVVFVVFIAFYVSSLLFVDVIVSSGDAPKMETSTQLITYLYLKINLNAFSVALIFLVMILGYDIYSDELKQILNSQLY